MTHLVLALARSSWGETTLALRIAEGLRRAGDKVVFVIHRALAKLFFATPFEIIVAPDIQGPAFDAFLGHVVRGEKPNSIILADFLMAFEALRRREAHPQTLSRFSVPIIGIDTWHFPEIGDRIDVRPDHELTVAPKVASHPFRLVPVPFIRPSAGCGVQLLPEVLEPGGIRRELSLPEGPMATICTSGWQQRDSGLAHMDRVKESLPRLLDIYLRRLRVPVCHVGPRAYPWTLDGRYHHRSQLPSLTFSRLITSATLVVSTNLCATTNTLAIAAGVPVVSVINDHLGEGLEHLDYSPSKALAQWAAEHLPLYRFRMWPMSGYRTLSMVLGGNPYGALLHPVQVLDERRFESTSQALLAGEADRGLRERYLGLVHRLPTPAERVHRYCRLST
ncbi:MAG: hypothetical protein HN348_03165 [Proteobacteria bacterium]|jgi:hypothetical protein|nr:hypothetical protein [Pseudomonadota bacterium]